MNEARDPDASFIAQDGLDYEDLAAYLLGQPFPCNRNTYIQALRAKGRSEEAIREWIKGYDGCDPTPSFVLERQAREAQTSTEAVDLSARVQRRHSRALAATGEWADHLSL